MAVLLAELGPHGIRVLTLQTGGIPETIAPRLAAARAGRRGNRRADAAGRAATLADVASVAAFAASDQAAAA